MFIGQEAQDNVAEESSDEGGRGEVEAGIGISEESAESPTFSSRCNPVDTGIVHCRRTLFWRLLCSFSKNPVSKAFSFQHFCPPCSLPNSPDKCFFESDRNPSNTYYSVCNKSFLNQN